MDLMCWDQMYSTIMWWDTPIAQEFRLFNWLWYVYDGSINSLITLLTGGTMCIDVHMEFDLIYVHFHTTHDRLKVIFSNVKHILKSIDSVVFPTNMHPSTFKRTVSDINLKRRILINILFNSLVSVRKRPFKRDWTIVGEKTTLPKDLKISFLH